MPDRENAIVIAMARQAADATADARGRETFSFDEYGLIRFAALVAAQEREANAKLCDQAAQEYNRMAKGGDNSGASDHMEIAAANLAEDIRARKEET